MNYHIASRTDRDAQHLIEELGTADYCREHVTLKTSADLLRAGTVLKDDGAGLAIIHDGTGDAIGILYAERDASDGDVRAVMNVRATVYKKPLLVFADAVTDPQKEAVMAAMTANGLIGRDAY